MATEGDRRLETDFHQTGNGNNDVGFGRSWKCVPGKVARPPQWLHGLSARLGSKSSGLWQKFSCPRIARNWKAVLLQGTSLRKGDTCNHFITSWKLNTQLYLRCHLDS